MEPTTTDAAPAESSTATNNESESSGGGADLLQEMRDFVGKSGQDKPSASKSKKDAKAGETPKPVDMGTEDKPVEEVATPEEVKAEDKPVPFETFKKRVDKLTAQRHAEADRADKAEMQVQRLAKAVELLQAENKRYLPQVKLDPKDEQIRAFELEKQVDEFNRSLEQTFTERKATAAQQAAIDEKAQSFVAEALAASKTHGVDARHILEILQVSTASPTEIAQRLAALKPAAAPTPVAPKTVAAAGKTSGNAYLVDDYPTSQTMADFLKTLE